MRKNQKYAVLGLAALLMGLFSWLPLNGQVEGERTERPKNVILLIGDGMGISQVSSAYYFKDEKDAEREPSFSRFKYIGLAKTSSGREVV
ncbi:MAG: alkaline phosphatase, partial [Bacteroidales bacterium]|nr:alkaline phosphatase [Bacteroidales bacterium]